MAGQCDGCLGTRPRGNVRAELVLHVTNTRVPHSGLLVPGTTNGRNMTRVWCALRAANPTGTLLRGQTGAAVRCLAGPGGGLPGSAQENGRQGVAGAAGRAAAGGPLMRCGQASGRRAWRGRAHLQAAAGECASGKNGPRPCWHRLLARGVPARPSNARKSSGGKKEKHKKYGAHRCKQTLSFFHSPAPFSHGCVSAGRVLTRGSMRRDGPCQPETRNVGSGKKAFLTVCLSPSRSPALPRAASPLTSSFVEAERGAFGMTRA